MLTHLFGRILHITKSAWARFVAFGRRVGWGKVTAGAVVLLLVFIFGRSLLGGGTSAEVVQNDIRRVEVATVAELSSQSTPLSIVGTVSSQSEATVRAEKSGEATSVNRSLGQYVSAGTIVAEIANAGERAAVLQAQGSVDAATVNLTKVQGPTGESAKTAAVNALLTAYGAVDSAVHGTADTMFSNPDGTNPQFFISSSNSQLPITINGERFSTAGPISGRQAARAKTLTVTDNLDAELTKTLDEVRKVRSFLDLILQALNSGVPNQTVSQADITASITAATAARSALTTALSSLASAQTTLTTGGSGAASADVGAAEAALKQAQGSLAAARANLEKSIIRAPISGTINSFSLKRGDFVTAGNPVLTVANNGALEIVAYVTDQDARDITVGTTVTIEGDGKGVVTRVAPAIDPLTKKIEVGSGVSNNENIINGQSVLVNLKRANRPTTTAKPARITIPITAIKIGATDTTVFTVASSTLVAHPVTLGQLLGERVVITEGLTADMTIVTDARGLREGQVVDVQ